MTKSSDKEPGGAAARDTDRTPEEFSLETRYVVLNCFGLVPSVNADDSQGLNASSGSSHRSASRHSRSSSNSSHREQLLEFTDDQPAHNFIVDSDGLATSPLKYPVAATKSLPRTEVAGLVDHSSKIQYGPPRRKDLLIRKSSGENNSEDVLLPKISKYELAQGKRMLRRLIPKEGSLAEESEDETDSGRQKPCEIHYSETKDGLEYYVNQWDGGQGGAQAQAPTQPQEQSQQLPSSSENQSDKIQESGCVLEVLPTTGTIDRLNLHGARSHLAERQFSDPGIERRTIEVSAFSRGRSLSPARPQTLDLSEDVPKSKHLINWREVDHAQEKCKKKSKDINRKERADDASGGLGEAASQTQSSVSSDEEVRSIAISRSPSMEQGASDRPDHTTRQSSSVSTGSTSLPSPTSPLGESFRSNVSSRTSLADMNMTDVATLVQAHMLPSLAIQLKEELNEQWQEWERLYEEAVSTEHVRNFLTPSPSSDSPESEVARRLCMIGDAVQEEYGEAIERAMEGVLCLPPDRLTYEVFISTLIRSELISSQLRAWKDVALLVLFGQRLVLGLLSRGSRQVGRLVDFTVRAINDRAARFILDQGGWSNIPDLEFDLGPNSAIYTDIRDHLNNNRGAETSDASPQTISTSVSENTITCEDLSTIDGATSTPSAMPVATSSDNDPQPMGAESPREEDRNKPLDDGEKSPDPTPDSGFVTSSNGQLTPEEQKSIDDAVNSVRHEIQLIRQVSSDLKAEFELSNNNRKPSKPSWAQMVVLTAALAALTFGSLVAFRRYTHR